MEQPAASYEVRDGVAEITMHRAPANTVDVARARRVIGADRRAWEDDAARAGTLANALLFSGDIETMRWLKDTTGSPEALRAFVEKRATVFGGH